MRTGLKSFGWAFTIRTFDRFTMDEQAKMVEQAERSGNILDRPLLLAELTFPSSAMQRGSINLSPYTTSLMTISLERPVPPKSSLTRTKTPAIFPKRKLQGISKSQRKGEEVQRPFRRLRMTSTGCMPWKIGGGRVKANTAGRRNS